MALILMTEYAARHGRNPDSVVQKAKRGTFMTAKKIGRQWFIDEDEPYSDARVTSGKYIDWRKKKSTAKEELAVERDTDFCDRCYTPCSEAEAKARTPCKKCGNMHFAILDRDHPIHQR